MKERLRCAVRRRGSEHSGLSAKHHGDVAEALCPQGRLSGRGDLARVARGRHEVGETEPHQIEESVTRREVKTRG